MRSKRFLGRDKPGYDIYAESYFNTKLGTSAMYIPWKKEFLYKPVFRKTVESVEGPVKLDEPLTIDTFNNNSGNLRIVTGLPDRL